MLNGEINEFTVDEELTQVASYFNIVDNAIKTGDTNKQYKISTQPCEAAPAPFDLGSWTSIPLSAQGENMVDLYNSFLTVDIQLPKLIIPDQNKNPFPNFTGSGIPDHFLKPALWFGFKDSANIVAQYQLVANGQTFYTQSYAIEESYITSLATTEAVKHVDTFSKATHEDVWKGTGTSLTGRYIDYGNYNASDTENSNLSPNIISLKIDFRRFLPLASIKYIPDFVGNLEMRIKFSLDGLVVAPAGPERIVGGDLLQLSRVRMANGITNKFVPYKALENGDDSLFGITGAAWADQSLTLTNLTATVDSKTGTVGGTLNAPEKILTLTVGNIQARFSGTPKIKRCESHLAHFGLDPNIYNQLAARYIQPNPSLHFPIQTMSFHQMNGSLGSPAGTPTPSITAMPRFVDSIFILFPKTSDYHTCFDNIMADSYQLHMGGYGSFPTVQYQSWSPEFLEVSANVFNVNNDLTGFSKDVLKSLVNQSNNVRGFYSRDTSNFVLAIPTSTDNTFQQGQTSNTTINYHLILKLNSSSPFFNNAECSPMICFLKDSVLAIQLRQGGAPPIVTLDEYDVTSPAPA